MLLLGRPFLQRELDGCGTAGLPLGPSTLWRGWETTPVPDASSVLCSRGVSCVTWISGLILGTWDLGSCGGGSCWSRGPTALRRDVRGRYRPAPATLRIHQWPHRAQGTQRPVRVRRNVLTRVKRWDRRCGAPAGSARGVQSLACLHQPKMTCWALSGKKRRLGHGEALKCSL